MGWVAYTNQGVPKGGPTLDPLTISTSLPASPTIGKEIVFQTAAMAALSPPVAWRLYYDGSKWVYLGGPPLIAEVANVSSESTTSTSYTNIATVGPSVDIPVVGDYDVTVGCRAHNTGAFSCSMSYAIGATAAVDADCLQHSQVVNVMATGSRTRRKTGLAAATTLLAKYKVSGGTGQFGLRWIMAQPVRLG